MAHRGRKSSLSSNTESTAPRKAVLKSLAQSTSEILLPHIRSDEPIQTADKDILGRQQLANAIAKTILDLDARNGAVVAIVGPWGSGKTSLIRLTQRETEKLSDVPFLEFNPWMFSRADELIERFFSEIGSQLKEAGGRLSEIANEMAAYGQVLEPLSVLPVLGTWARAGKDTVDSFKSIAEHREGGVLGKRKALVNKLNKLTLPIVVVIDDIDRLPPDEIRDVFKLVRLTGNFPNIVYLVAFDRDRVERALEEQGLPGREYLEKIAQVIIDIPDVPDAVLHQQIELVLTETIELVSGSPMRVTDRLVDVFHEVLRPNFRHMRDIRRYGASIPATIRSLEGRIAMEDVLALEAIRLFHPDIFKWISQHRNVLTYVRSSSLFSLSGTDEAHGHAVRELLEQHPEKASLIKSVIRTLFPLADHHVENVVYDESSLADWQIAHRVAHPQFLALYLDRMANQELAEYWFAEQAMEIIGDLSAFVNKMMSIPAEERVPVIQALQVLALNVPEDQVVAALIGILNLADSLPKFGAPTLRLAGGDPRRELRVLVYRLVSRVPSAGATEDVVNAVLPNVRSVGAKLLLLKIVGTDPNSGHGLISQAASDRLQAELRDEIRNLATSDFVLERDILWTLMWTKKSRQDPEPEFAVPHDKSLRCAILKDALSRAVIFGNRGTQVEDQLHWNTLIELLGDEDEVRAVIDECSSTDGDEDLRRAADLGGRYLEGWRPEHGSP